MEAGVPPAAPPPAAAAPAVSDYPIRYDVEYKEQASRLTTFFRLFMLIPQIIVLYILFIVAEILVIIAWFAIVITGKYPKGMFDFVVNVMRWSANVSTYASLLRDEYPPFSWDPGLYPVTYEVDYHEPLSRLTTALRIIWVIPQLVVLYFVRLLYILVVVMWFAIVFTGKVPRGMFDLILGVNRWTIRVQGYLLLVTDKYPPFSLN